MLDAKPAIGRPAVVLGQVEIAEITGHTLLSLAFPSSQIDGQNLPAIGHSDDWQGGLAMRLAHDQIFWLGKDEAPEFSAGYQTDQSDSWARIAISGGGTIAVLERLCPVDLDPHKFPNGAVARTMMEHLSAILMRKNENSFEIFTPRSSAGDFWHALEEQMTSVAAD